MANDKTINRSKPVYVFKDATLVPGQHGGTKANVFGVKGHPIGRSQLVTSVVVDVRFDAIGKIVWLETNNSVYIADTERKRLEAIEPAIRLTYGAMAAVAKLVLKDGADAVELNAVTDVTESRYYPRYIERLSYETDLNPEYIDKAFREL